MFIPLNPKEFLQKHKWLISIFISALILLGIIIYLYCTNRLEYLFNWNWDLFLNSLTKVQKWILSASLIAVVVLNIFINLFSSFLYDLIFPNPGEKILKNTKEIISKQDELTSIALRTEAKVEKLDELQKKSKIDSHAIEQYLKELPIKNGEVETKSKIDKWYKIGKISSKEEKELLFVVISVIFEQNKVLSEEIKDLKSKGKSELAGILESIQKYYIEGNADKIKEAYFSRKEKLKQENIIILKQSIKATETLFAIEETKDLYQELISLEPSAESYFQFAYFLQKLNYFDDAANYYQEALKIYRELARENPRTYLPYVATTLNNLAVLQKDKNEFPQALEKYEEALKIYRELARENPRTYLPYVATTLNNLAVLHSDKNEFPQALEKYEEALKIYRELARENPRTYLPYVATTLNNLAVLHSDKNEFPQALEKYEEALKIRRELAQENPRTYEIDYAQMIVMGVVLFERDKGDLKKAKIILKKYVDVYKAQKLLELIKRLE